MFDSSGDEVAVLAQNDVNDYSHRVSTTGDERLYLGGTAEPLSDDDFAALFDHPAWSSVDKLFIVTACYSGGFWGSTTAGDSGDLTQLPHAALLAAASEENFAYAQEDSEGFIWGLLGQALVEVLGGLSDRQGVTLSELASQVSIRGSQFSGEGYILGLEENWGVSVPIEFGTQVEATEDFSLHLVGVPEPSSLVLLTVAAVTLLSWRRRHR